MQPKIQSFAFAPLNIFNYFKIKFQTRLDLPRKYQETLENADFTTTQGLKAAVEAGNALKVAMNSDIDKALLQMTAVQEQRRRFEKYKEKFSRSISRQLNNLFIHYGNHKGESDKNIEGLILPQHSGVHKELNSYIELMHWIKVTFNALFFFCNDSNVY
jgi:NhaP-type Na+/H+ and K+/H+ antiporter